MPRAAKLRRKDGHWFTQAGGREGAYFGRVDQVPYQEAQRLFGEYLASLRAAEHQQKPLSKTVAEVCDAHLEFVQRERSPALYSQRKCLLNAVCNHTIGEWRCPIHGRNQPIGLLRAELLTRGHIEEYLHHCKTNPNRRTGKPLGDKSLRAISVSIKACWNWAADKPIDGGGGLLPSGHRPLRKLPRGYVRPVDLTESDLPTDAEIAAIHRWALADLSKVRGEDGRYHARDYTLRDTCEEAKAFAALMQVYDATGARTSELCQALVRDFMPRARGSCVSANTNVS